jgi:hypothetical protein
MYLDRCFGAIIGLWLAHYWFMLSLAWHDRKTLKNLKRPYGLISLRLTELEIGYAKPKFRTLKIEYHG